jgi:uncharacterized protein (TIGR00299 family) protein
LKILYFDCFAGISGDMSVGALLDLGVPLNVLLEQLAGLAIPRSSYSLFTENASRKGIRACKFSVRVEEHQPHRHYTDIAGIIEKSALADRVKEWAQRIFFRLAEAEAKVHGVEIGHVHFHEVGAIDSIVDIVGTAICLDCLDIGEIHVSALPLGSGYVETAHGMLPVPAPATVELLCGIPIHGTLGEGERVTPTGAAIVAALGNSFGDTPSMTILATGYGAGDRDFPDVPNILRVVIGEKTGAGLPGDELYVAETNIDDMSPEILGFLMERLFAGGALDVGFSPLQMKKNRPGVKLTFLCPPEKLQSLARVVLAESTAIGLRYYPVSRIKLERSTEERDTSLGRVLVKVIRGVDGSARIVPEFEECRRIALEKGIPLLDVYKIIEREAFSQ